MKTSPFHSSRVRAAETSALGNPQDRARLIRLLHVAKRDLQMADDTYRGVLMSVASKSSSSELSVTDLYRVLEHMKKAGFKVRVTKTADGKKRQSSRPLAQHAEDKKIRALWLLLHQLGAVKNPSEEALAAYVKRLTGVDALQWINGAQSLKLIESLKKWAMRFLPAAVKSRAEEVSAAIRTGSLQLEPQIINALGVAVGLAQSRKTFDPMLSAWELLNEVGQQKESGDGSAD
ncbi:gp16 family protein [Rhodocyclus tenuis]|uniref:Phage gp16-like protein n=1 Tax=Rhodocyclus tenuis TaxID=1066 RepID=A0A840GBT7_RHOTE|nr:regulatory protein GemA [Rhodocyclus tenuis]MBB4248340.1 phage gp16-like protein [Rhodocyclus tenuis]